ncbi:MAG: AraC family transcriptional regulator ligand-binding domain-containing protein [Pseudomonadota bacterium]
MTSQLDPRIHVGKAVRIALGELGLDAATVLRRAGLPACLLEGEGSKITVAAFYDLWASVTGLAADPLLALKLGDASGIDYFDPAFFAAMCSPNMTVAARRLADYKRRVSPFTLSVQSAADETEVAFHCPPPGEPTLALTEIVFLVNFARRATRQSIVPRRVSLPFAVAERDAFEAHFGCEIVDRGRASVTFSAADAARPFVTHDDEMWALFEPKLRCQPVAPAGGASTRTKVAHCLNEFLPSGRATVEDVARALAMSKRTLQRRLAEEGTTWLDVLSEAREALAKHYLSATEYGPAEVSFLLGYEDPNSFFRAFRRWENTSPELWRTANRAPPQALH